MPPRFRPSLACLLPALALAFSLASPHQPLRAASPPQSLQRFADGFVSPLVLIPLDDTRLLVADQVGVLHVLNRSGQRLPEPFLDLRSRLTPLKQGFDERGLLGVALHPQFAQNRRMFVYYSAPRRSALAPNWDHTSQVSEFTVAPNLLQADPASEKVLLRIDQPYFNHNGGRMAFGTDGLLYIGVGDGGNAHDLGFDRAPTGNGQDLTTLLGKILRIDIDHPAPGQSYGIPQDNPFVGKTGARPEIYAWGLRNPWGMAFDRADPTRLFAADVGQGRYEEVNLIVRGGNYGWNLREGHHPFDPKNPVQVDAPDRMPAADRDAFLDPIVEYKNLNAFSQDPAAAGLSITGGYLYRGRALPHLHGQYIFGDWSRQWAAPDGRLFVARPPQEPTQKSWSWEPLPVASHPDLKIGAYVVAFAEDRDGELFVLTSQRTGLVDRTGIIWKLVPPPPGS
jgi:glucose/arabinose dehydrogenase